MTETELRQSVVDVMRGWLGWTEANGKFRRIIDLYNTQNPLPRRPAWLPVSRTSSTGSAAAAR